MNLIELAERCEAASGPDRALDWAIHIWRGLEGVGPYGQHPAYTGSWDDAGALVERAVPGAQVSLTIQSNGWTEAVVSLATGAFLVAEDVERHGGAATPPLALVAATLRAVAATQPNAPSSVIPV